MTRREARALFILAGIRINGIRRIPNQYLPQIYTKDRLENPWWQIETPKGNIDIGRLKHSIYIDWSGTPIRQIITKDDVMKGETVVYAFGYPKAVEYLETIDKIMRCMIMKSNISFGIELNTLCLDCGVWNQRPRSDSGRCAHCQIQYAKSLGLPVLESTEDNRQDEIELKNVTIQIERSDEVLEQQRIQMERRNPDEPVI